MLVERIDDHDVAPSSTLMLANPMLSYAPAGSQRDEFSGVLYAYVIELILARDVLHDDKDCTFLLSQGDYAYGHGVIAKGKKVISSLELEHVKQRYSKWWEKNRNKGLYTFRFEWKKSIRPLTGSDFEWM